MGGWHKAPEYGGPRKGWWGYLWLAALVALSTLGVTYGSMQAQAQPESGSPVFSELRVGEEFWGVASVSDADTIRIAGQRVRLWGIDAPERDQTCSNVPAGELARDAFLPLAEGRRVFCVVRMRPNNGRAVAQCLTHDGDDGHSAIDLDGDNDAPGIDLAGAVVDAGWAWDSPRFSRGYYAERERAARESQLGVWTLQREAPWAYRERQRSRHH